MKKNIILLIIIMGFSLWCDDVKVIAQLSPHKLSSYINGDNGIEDYLLHPWPYEKSKLMSAQSPTDLYIPIDMKTLDFSVSEKHILNRLNLLWRGEVAFTIKISEDNIETFSHSGKYDKLLLFLSNCYKKGYYSIINWDLRLNDKRKDYSLIESLYDDINFITEEEITMTYSLGRYTQPCEFLSERADYIIIKSYDNSGRHSTYENAEEAVENFIRRRNMDPSKLVLVIPLYGRKFRSTDPGYWIDMIPYKDIISKYNPEPDVNETDYYYFNGIEIAKKKYELVINKKLAGVALYPIDWDTEDNTSLLTNLMRY